MKLQAVTVSVNYSDFLCHTLEENKKLFDKWVIVTDTKDIETKELCDKYKDFNVVCVQTDLFYQKALFNKYAGVNEGLKLIDTDAWVLFIDSDIVLHEQTRRVLESIDLEEDTIYGVDRVNCKGYENWFNFKIKRNLVVDNWLLTTAGFDLGARLVHYYGYENGDGKFAGWNPLGFFQLAHHSAFDMYPQNSIGADHCDLVFARQWPRNKRVNIPEILAIHLESEFIIKGTNWYGRLSQPFTNEHKPKLTVSYLFKVIRIKILLWIDGLKLKRVK